MNTLLNIIYHIFPNNKYLLYKYYICYLYFLVINLDLFFFLKIYLISKIIIKITIVIIKGTNILSIIKSQAV